MIQVLLNMIPAWQFLYSAYDSKTKYINTNNNGDNKNWETTETTAVTDLLVSDSIIMSATSIHILPGLL